MKNVFILVFILIQFAGISCFAQGIDEYVSDMEKMKNKLQSNFSVEIAVTNQSLKGFSPTIKAVIHKNGSDVNYVMMHMEYLFTSKYTIMVDHRKKNISYTKPTIANGTLKQWVPPMDTLLMLNDSVVYKGLINGLKKYCIYNSRNIIKYAEIYFDPKIDFVSKMIYTYNAELIGDDGSVSIEYSKVDFAPVFKSNEFYESRYIKVNGKEIIPASSLVGYSISAANTDVENY